MGHKLKFVVSDLHIGAGHRNNGGNYLEDFTADEMLADFLREMQYESENDQREIELIINGDFLEFLQVPAVENYNPQEFYPASAYLDSSEAASLRRLDIIVEGHPEIFNALSDFLHVKTPQRRITIIKGNHDVNLYWPGVKSRLREVLGASGLRASLLLFAAEFVSREKIYVEHGHQRTETINSYPDFLDPRLPHDLTQLYYPAGSHFVINYLNNIEHERWFVDSIKPMTTLIWYAFRWDFNLAAQIFLNFVRYVSELAASDHEPAAPVEALLQGLESEERRRVMSQRYAKDSAFRRRFHQQVQHYLANVNRAAESVARSSAVDAPPDPLALGRAEQAHQQSILRRAAEKIARQEGAQVILFGHTHHPVQESLTNGAVYINTGCWVEDFSDDPPETWADLFQGLRQYGDTLGRLPYARIDYAENEQPTGRLLYFANPNPISEANGQFKSFFERNFNWLIKLFRPA